MFNHIFRPQSLSISSDPLLVCLCNSNVIVRCGDLVIPVAAYPGKSIPVSVVTLGQRYGGTAGVIRAQTLNSTVQFQELEISKQQAALVPPCTILF